MQINISTNFPQVKAALDQVRKDIGQQALVRSLNRTVETARTDMGREIRKEFMLPAAYVRERLVVRRAFAKADAIRLSAELRGGDGKRRSANIIRFVEQMTTLAQGRKRAKLGTQAQLHVKVRRGAAKPLGPAFIGNKGRTVFVRTGKARLPIKPVQTIDVAQMFNTKRINQAVVRAIEARFPATFKRELAFYLKRAGL